MHTIAGRILKYILWIILIFIVGLLLIGLTKFRRNVGSYIDFLNTRDWNQAWGQLSIAHPSSFGYMFWGSGGTTTTGEIHLLSGDFLSGSVVTGDAFSGLDAYDPSLEDELNTLPGDAASGDSGYGFTSSDDTRPSSSSGTSQEQLLNLIRQRELKK